MSDKQMFLLIGYKNRIFDNHYPTVYIYGMYEERKDAESEQARLCGTEVCKLPVVHGNLFTTWIKEIKPGNQNKPFNICGAVFS